MMPAASGRIKSAAVATAATFSVFVRLEITYFYLWFVFLFFAHITFLSCFFGFGLCDARQIGAVRRQPSYREGGHPTGLASLLNASADELHAPRYLRPFFPSTNSRFRLYHYPCQMDLMASSYVLHK
jgi:hypothetical protein